MEDENKEKKPIKENNRMEEIKVSKGKSKVN